jgi:hypothetical protein
MGAGLSMFFDGVTLNTIIAQANTLKMDTWTIIGAWLAAFLTICIFSFLYEDNPFYKFAEHLYIGVSAGYFMAITYQNVIKPNLFGKIQTAYNLMTKQHIMSWEDWSYIIAGILGIMLVLKLVPKVNWLSRWPLSFMVGMSSGLGVVLTMEALVIKQVDATIVNLLVKHFDGSINWAVSIQNWLIVVGVCSSLIYFYFSKEHKGLIFGTASRIGIYTLMIAFGAAFGYTVMARVSLLIGRMQFFQDVWWPAFKATFGMS